MESKRGDCWTEVHLLIGSMTQIVDEVIKILNSLIPIPVCLKSLNRVPVSASDWLFVYIRLIRVLYSDTNNSLIVLEYSIDRLSMFVTTNYYRSLRHCSRSSISTDLAQFSYISCCWSIVQSPYTSITRLVVYYFSTLLGVDLTHPLPIYIYSRFPITILLSRSFHTMPFSGFLSTVAATSVAAITLSWLVQTLKQRYRGPDMPPKYPHLDPFFGLDWVVMEIRNYVACRELPATTDLFRRIGNTFEINALRRTMIMTIDPENIHSPVASEGRDWSIEPVKVRFMDLVRGRESVSSYVFQRHSIRYRALVMRQVFLNLMKVSQGFRESVNDLLNLIPRHGASVDLAELFPFIVRK